VFELSGGRGWRGVQTPAVSGTLLPSKVLSKYPRVRSNPLQFKQPFFINYVGVIILLFENYFYYYRFTGI